MTTAVVNFDSTVARRIGPPPLTSAVTSWNGLTGAVKGTLAEIWAFGAGDDPFADNLFAFPSGNLRFVGSTTALQLPATGFFESSTTPGDPRIGTDYIARYYRLGAHVGGTVFDQLDGYDPTWNGTFRAMDGIQHISTQVGFANGTGGQVAPGARLTVGQQRWPNEFGFFSGTDYWPIVGFNDGARESVSWDLYCEGDFPSPATAERGKLTGYGTWEGRPLVLEHGTTAAFDTRARFLVGGGLSPGDGVGWFVRNFTDDPPRGILRWYSVDGNVSTGNGGWELMGANGAATLLSMLRVDPTAGASFSVPITGSTATLDQVNAGAPDIFSDPTFIKVGSYTDGAFDTGNVWIANRSTDPAATSNIYMFAGSWDGSVGSSVQLTTNSPNALTATGGPGSFIFRLSPDNANADAVALFWNGGVQVGNDLAFRVGNHDGLRIYNPGGNTGAFVQVPAPVAPGATAVAITNSPGVSGTPVEYWPVKNATGQTRWIPLLS